MNAHFLVAVDGSPESETALAYAIDVADAMDGSITAVHAVDPSVYEAGGDEPVSGLADADRRLVLESVEEAEERGVAVLDDAAALAANLGLTVETELLYGDPVDRVAEYAEEEGFDAVFVGHRGRSARAERMLGSVATGLVERVTRPVTVVR
ncbi:MAG: universal stress protein [Haloferacaceae archaeon]